MHKNTFFVVTILAIFAGFVTLANIRHWMSGDKLDNNQPIVIPTPTQPMTTVANVPYQNSECGITLAYPRTHAHMDNPDGGVMFIYIDHPTETVSLICQQKISPPEIVKENIEEYLVSSVSAKIYRDTKPEKGKPSYKLIFHNPATNLDIMISGVGDVFRSVIKTVKIIR